MRRILGIERRLQRREQFLVAAGDRHRGQATEKQREVGLAFGKRFQELAGQFLIGRLQAELLRERLPPGLVEAVGIEVESLFQLFALDQRQQRLGEARQVPLRDARLVAVAVAPPLRVGGVRRPHRVITLEPAIRAVVDRHAEDREVVGIHHAVHEAQAHPVDHQERGAPAHFLVPARGAVPGEVLAHHVVGEALERLELVVRREDLEVAEAHEGRRNAADDRARLGPRMAVVEHVADHRIAGADEAQRPGGRHAQMEHGLAAHEFTQRRAQHRAAIGGARIRRFTRALELQLLARAVAGDDFGERDGAPVAELPGPMAELVAAVARGVRLHAGQHAIAAQHLHRQRARTRQAERLAKCARPAEQARRRHRCRLDARVARVAHLARHVDQHRVGRQVAHECILEARVCEIDERGATLGCGDRHGANYVGIRKGRAADRALKTGRQAPGRSAENCTAVSAAKG